MLAPDQFVHLLCDNLSPDPDVRNPAYNVLSQIRRTIPNVFVQMCFAVIGSPSEIPPIAIASSVILCRQIFLQSCEAKRNGEQDKQYLVISDEFLANALDQIFVLFENPTFFTLSAATFAAISVHLITFNLSSTIFERLLTAIQSNSNEVLSQSCALALSYIFCDFTDKMPAPLIVTIFASIYALLFDQNQPLQIKPALMSVINCLVDDIHDVFPNLPDCEPFLLQILNITTIEQMKESCLVFWSSLAQTDSSLFLLIPQFFEYAANEIQMNSDESTVTSLLYTLNTLGQAIYYSDDQSYIELVRGVFAQLLPIFVVTAEHIPDITILDVDADSTPHIAAKDMIGVLMQTVPDIGMSVLQAYFDAHNSSADPIKRELALCFIAIVGDSVDDDQFSQLHPVILQLVCQRLLDQSPRIVHMALKVLDSLIDRTPPPFDFGPVDQILIGMAQIPMMDLVRLVFQCMAKTARFTDLNGANQIFMSLLSTGHPYAFYECRYIIDINLDNENIAPFCVSLVPQVFAIAAGCLESNDDNAIALLGSSIALIESIVVGASAAIADFCPQLTAILDAALAHNCSECIAAMGAICRATQNETYLEQVIGCILTILQDATNFEVAQSPVLVQTAITTLGRHLSNCPLPVSMHTLGSALVAIIGSAMIEVEVKVDALDTIHSLLQCHRTEMTTLWQHILNQTRGLIRYAHSIDDGPELDHFIRTVLNVSHDGLLFDQPEIISAFCPVAIDALKIALQTPESLESPETKISIFDIVKALANVSMDQTTILIANDFSLQSVLAESDDPDLHTLIPQLESEFPKTRTHV